MKLLQLTHEASAANLAIDEALLESAEATAGYPEVLRIWEPKLPLVVLGRSSPADQETNSAFCRTENVEVLRRCSGGQTIVTGPGCLMYAVLLNYQRRPELRMLDLAHRFVMGQMQAAISRLEIDVDLEGTSDLTYQGRKFSGNSMRCKRDWFIYHGTMICDIDIELIARCLGTPVRQPEYRENRSHQDFLIQLPTTTTNLSQAIGTQWGATEILDDWPEALTNRLTAEKYSCDEWTYIVK